MPQNILVIKLGALGDIIFADGVLRALRAHHRDATITLLTGRRYRAFMEKCPHIDHVGPPARVEPWQWRARARLARHLRQARFDFVYDLQGNAASARICRRLRGVSINGRTESCHQHYRRDESRRVSEAVYLAEQVGLAGLDAKQIAPPDMRWAATPVAHILEAHNISDGFVLLIPGSSRVGKDGIHRRDRGRHTPRTKRWPHYAELCRRLNAAGFTCITAPGPQEAALCADLPATALYDEGKFLSFEQLAGLAAHAGFVVGNDTGPTHLLATCGTKGLALFGGYHPFYRTGIETFYDVISVDDLAELPVEQVHAHICAAYAPSV